MLRYSSFVSVILLMLMVCGCVSSQTTTGGSAVNAQDQDLFAPDRPPTAQTLYYMADLLTKQGRTSQAEQTYRRIINEYPEFLMAYNDLAALLMSQRRIPEAMVVLETGLKVNPHDPVLLNNTGMCWLIRKQYDNALYWFTEAAGVIPENTRYRSNMATALALMGRRDEALTLYRQILPEEEAFENIRILCDVAEKEQQ